MINLKTNYMIKVNLPYKGKEFPYEGKIPLDSHRTDQLDNLTDQKCVSPILSSFTVEIYNSLFLFHVFFSWWHCFAGS